MSENLSTLYCHNINISNDQPFVLMGGMNVLESSQLAMEVAEHFVKVTQALNIPYIFKASFDKANRSSIHSFRGPGLEQGLTWLADIKNKFNVPIITDIHEPAQAKPVSEVADILQIPAFLSRQTDLLAAACETGAIIQIKKAQFLAAHEMRHIIKKCHELGNEKVILCERGSAFGYNNLVVDMLGIDTMKRMQVPVTFDVTHALQLPGAGASSAGGRRQQLMTLARAGLSLGLAGIFLEAHPDPKQAKCDGPCALPLHKLEDALKQMQSIDQWAKSQNTIDIE